MSSLQHHAICHRGTERTRNEDAVLACPEAGLWAVADGMGGHQAGDFASQCLIEYLSEACAYYKGNALVHKVQDFITQAHLAIYKHSLQLAGKPMIGSTIVTLVLEADNFHCFWSGDSRCYLLRNQKLTLLTEDHTEAQTLMASGGHSGLTQTEKISAENTLVHAIGIDNEAPHIDYVSGYLYENDRFLLCSDGINKIYNDYELTARMQMGDAELINQLMLSDALNSGAPDNLSSVIVELD
jgi:protein phosphatase